MHWISYGPDALLFTFAEHVGEESFRLGRAIAADVERDPPPGLVEFVPGFTTLLLEFDTAAIGTPAKLGPILAQRFAAAATVAVEEPPPKNIPVTYDGEDLEAVARAHQLTTAEVRELHSAPIYRVHLLGF